MALSSFCGVVTLQVGTASLGIVYVFISALIIETNVFDYSGRYSYAWPVPMILLSVFAIVMVLTGLTMFFSAYNESKVLCKFVMILIILMVVYWIILSVLSFFYKPTVVRKICLSNRCPESFWIASFPYRKLINRTNNFKQSIQLNKEPFDVVDSQNSFKDLKLNKKTEHIEERLSSNGIAKYFMRRRLNPDPLNGVEIDTYSNSTVLYLQYSSYTENNIFRSSLNLKWNSKQSENEINPVILDNNPLDFINKISAEREVDIFDSNEKPITEEEFEYLIGFPLIGAIVFFIGNLLFFGTTIIVLWSYYQEVSYLSHYDGD